jgi:hypothetical protein
LTDQHTQLFSSGIGLATARQFVNEGAYVFVDGGFAQV